MAAPTLYTTTRKYKVPKGIVLFNRKRSDGTYEGYRDMGNTPGADIAIESANLTHVSSRGGLAETDLDTPISITRSGTLVVDDFNLDNLAAFLGATVSEITQTSTSVTNEEVNGIRAERAYQLGTNVVGVRNISAVAVDINAASRANSTAYAIGDIYQPATPNNHIYVCTVAGTSDASPPVFTTDGTDFTDGTATFLDIGDVSSLVSGTDFLIDGALGLLSIPADGKLGLAWAAAIAVLDDGVFSIDIHVDYTRPAATFDQVATGSTSALEGMLKIIADNPIGENQDVVMPSVTLRPNGALPFIGEGEQTEVASVEFAIGIGTLDTNTSAIYVNGRPAA